MKITDGEKLIILMLSELYEKVGISGEIDPDFIKSAIFSENFWGIPWKYPGIPFDDQDTPEVITEVLDILDMWSTLEFCYAKLSDEDKAHLKDAAEPFGKDPRFNGFDGNHEGTYMGAAMFIVNDLNRFDEFKGRDFNSHMASVDSYKRMLSVFEPILGRKSLDLSVEDLASILKEQIHPSNRG
jgi:uncharacterized protein YfbU (UPF0304 family)